MHVLVAGGAGFVGSHVAARLLAQGHELSIVDNLITGRVANLHALEEKHPGAPLDVRIEDAGALTRFGGPLDAVIHLAGPACPADCLRHPEEMLRAAATATRCLLDIAQVKGARFLLASTSGVYGDPEAHPQDETYWGHVDPVGPRSVYEESMRFAEAMAAAASRHRGTVVRIARIFDTYGPGMRLDDGRMIPTFITQALRGEPLTVYGSYWRTRSFCYVDDLVSGLLALLWSNVEAPVNLGAPDEHSVLEMAHLVLELTVSSSTIRHVRRPEDSPHVRCPSIERARRRLGWEPGTTLREGIARTVRDLSERLEAGESARSGGGASPTGNTAERMLLVPEKAPGSHTADESSAETVTPAVGAHGGSSPL